MSGTYPRADTRRVGEDRVPTRQLGRSGAQDRNPWSGCARAGTFGSSGSALGPNVPDRQHSKGPRVATD